MSNKIKLIWTTFIIVLFTLPSFVFAGFEITEIMYDLDGTDTNREWIEVKNTGSEPSDLSKWFFFSDNSKHALAPQGAPSVPAGGYAVITQNATNFQADWPNYSGLIFDSSWTGFNNESGETISMKDPSLTEVSIVSFDSSMGGAGDGNSIQKVGTSWVGATPTPGLENKASSGGGDEEEDDDGGSSSNNPVVVKQKEVEIPKMVTNIISKNTVFAGVPFIIDSNTIGYKKETLKVGRLVWNFGDGMSKQTSEHLPFEYLYQYPGEYVMTLSYYYPNDNIVDATDRVIFKVVVPGVTISSVGKSGDPYVEIDNKSGVEVDLSLWVINSANSSFRIPEGTIILPSKSIRLSGRVTGFSLSDLSYVNITSTSGEVISSYPTAKATTYTNTSSNYKPKVSTNPEESSRVINLEDLSASVGNSGARISNSTYAWLGLVGVIFIGLLAVYFSKRKDTQVDDIDKQISASDMTIIE